MIDLTSATPGPGLATALAEADPLVLDPAGLVDALIGFERLAGWVAAAQARILAELGPSLIDGGDDWLREEVAAALRLSGQTAQRRIDTARDLCSRLPGTLAALSTGQISYLHAVVIAEATRDLAASAVAAVEDRVLARAARQTVAEFRRAVTRAVLAADPVRAERAHEHAVTQRTVQTWSIPDGMAEIRALLDASDAALVMATVNALATKTGAADPRGIDARRADALVSVFKGALSGQGPSQGQRIRAQIQVTVPAATLLGLSETPGDLAGYGPVTAGVARELAATGSWRRLLTHPATGQLLDYGRRSYAPNRESTWPRLLGDPISAQSLDYGRRAYRPPAGLAQFVIARDRVCQFPGCNQPAKRCDLDHRTPWQHGGTTCPDNLTALCRRHHRAKHGPWILRRNPDGSITWISPTGKHYHQPPPSYDDP
ncbi:MAG: DUF222 domain-containing protein [Actinomycetes bacterium]